MEHFQQRITEVKVLEKLVSYVSVLRASNLIWKNSTSFEYVKV